MLLGAFLLDCFLVEPPSRYHPVRWFGLTVDWSEKLIRSLGMVNRWIGWCLALVLPLSMGLLTWRLLEFIPDYGLETLACVLLLWTLISFQSMPNHVHDILQSLDEGEIKTAQEKLSGIVGRNTDGMDSSKISKACVESIAEGYVDGLLSPLSWYMLGGLPFAVAYKTVNTMDSMIGYRNSRFREIGEGSARIDDLMNWFPARISILMITIGSYFRGLSWLRTWNVAVRDRLNHVSPNAAHSEAAFAGALNRRLGGPVDYGNRKYDRDYLNPDGKTVTVGDVKRALRLYRIVSIGTVFSIVMVLAF